MHYRLNRLSVIIFTCITCALTTTIAAQRSPIEIKDFDIEDIEIVLDDVDINSGAKCRPTSNNARGVRFNLNHPTGLNCQNGKIDMTISGGFPPYNVSCASENAQTVYQQSNLSGNDGREDAMM